MAEKRLIDQLFTRLTEEALEALTEAVRYCKAQRQDRVELVHWLHHLLRLTDSDIHRILTFFHASQTAVEREVANALAGIPPGYKGAPVISAPVRALVREAWLHASVGCGDERIRSGHLFLAALHDAESNDLLAGVSPLLARLPAHELAEQFDQITTGSPEASHLLAAVGEASFQPAGTTAVPAPGRRAEALAKFTEDLTEKARQGRIDPVIGRDDEIRQIIDILMRRRQNNPILTGDAGVGKTAVVEGFALRIAAGDVPEKLRGVSLRSLDVARMQAGAGVRGEFENRLKTLVDEVKAAGNVILFIDEAHTLIGAGGAAGQGDAANLLKPALARGELRTIAATTADEYKRFIEQDPALKRRFQEVVVAEPSEAKAILMLREVKPVLEKHHGVTIFDEALAAAARLTTRYVPARQLPDKAVGALDTACARVAMSQQTVPARVEDTRCHIAALKTELEVLDQEQILGTDHAKRLTAARPELAAAEVLLASLEDRWQKELALVREISDFRDKLRASTNPPASSAQPEQWQKALRAAQEKLATLQGDDPLIHSSVAESAIASVIADWTGIPIGRMVKDEIQATIDLPKLLGRRIVGQDHALEMIARRIRTAQARLEDPGKPIGSFLLAGPSGTGKTETALALAESRFGSERNLVVFNMNEFKEEHTASTLLGAPPGYKGFEQGGLLTEAIRRHPYSAVLLDEFEKAHKSIHELFFQVLDQGWTKDRTGRFVDFRNTILLFTTNAAATPILEFCKDPMLAPDPEVLAESIRGELRKHFADALLGRLTLVPFYPLTSETLAAVIGLKLARIQRRFRENHDVELTWDAAVLKHIGDRCTAIETGGRMVDALITNTLLPELSQEVLSRLLQNRPMLTARIAITDGRFAYEFT